MPISPDHSGRSYAPGLPYVVSQAKIAEFAAALGDADNPAYQGENAVAPPTFAVLIANAAWENLFTDPELDLELSRTIHVDQRFEYVRPLRVNDAIQASLTIEKVRVRGGTAILLGDVVALFAHRTRQCDLGPYIGLFLSHLSSFDQLGS